ncbi:MAG: hypothetical protein GC190_18425 [Alphaproteobacteria bacterium]|nr:hypothetical protein [Alphaproteobacteria bacterium]
MGAAVPPLVVGGAPEGAHEAWSSAKLSELSEEILAAVDSAADDWRPLNLSWRDPDQGAMFAERIRVGVEEEFGQAQTFVLKDPRLCRMLPFWMSALEAANIRSCPLIIVRNPLEVAASLQASLGIGRELASLMWLRHYLDAEVETRHLPRNIVTYEALLDDWRSIMVQSAGRLGLNWPRTPAEVSADVRAFLDHDLHHQRATKAELHAAADMPSWVKEAYEALTRLCDEPKSGYAKRELDKIRAAFGDSCKLFGTVAFADRQMAKHCEAEMHAANARAETADRLAAELEQAHADIAARDADLVAHAERHSDLEREHTAARGEIETHEATIAQLRNDHQVASEAADELEKRAEAAEAHIAELLNMVSDLEQRGAQSEEMLGLATQESAELRELAHDLIARIERVEKELQSHVARGAEANAIVDGAVESRGTLLATIQSNLVSASQLHDELIEAREAIVTHQSAALTAAADARKHADDLALAHKRIADLEAKLGDATAAVARSTELQRLIDDVQTSALRTSEDIVRGSEAQARLGRLEDQLRFERLRVMALERRLATWSGLIGAAFRKASGQNAKLTEMRALPKPAVN